LAGWTAVSGCDSWQTDGGIIAQRSDGFEAHVASALHGPFIILFEQQRTDESNDGGLVGEDADDVAAPLDLTIESFEWIGIGYAGPGFPWCPLRGGRVVSGQPGQGSLEHGRWAGRSTS
jgi:hypothetical protein